MLSPEKLKQIEADAEAFAVGESLGRCINGFHSAEGCFCDPLERGYVSGATAEADKAAALVEEKDREIERLRGLMWKAWTGGGNDCECEACIGFWQQFKSENNI